MLNRNYHFALKDNGTQAEEWGDIELNGDAAALTFGKLVMRDLIDKYAGHYNGWTLDITEDERAVGHLTVKSR